MHRVTVESTSEGWLVKRPGWPTELVAERFWAEKAAESLAFEFHQRSGRPACVVLQEHATERELARFA